MHPNPDDYGYELDRALESVVGVRAMIPDDAFTAEILGTERAGNGVLIRGDGVVLTIGYLIAEAETVWLNMSDGQVVGGHVLAYDHVTGFGLVQALARLELPALPFGQSASAAVGQDVVIGGAGGRGQSVASRIVAKQEFAGYWEYVLDEAIFTAPSHPNWGGAPLIGPAGDLLGIGSLQLQRSAEQRQVEDINMIVPIDVLKPVLDDLLTLGRPKGSPRPWLGLYATEIGGQIVVAALASQGPAADADLDAGDIVLGIGGEEAHDLAEFFRTIWSLGDAGIEVPLTILRDGRTFDVSVTSADRNDYLKAPVLH